MIFLPVYCCFPEAWAAEVLRVCMFPNPSEMFATNNSCRKGLLLIGLKPQKHFSKALNVFITLFVPLMFGLFFPLINHF